MKENEKATDVRTSQWQVAVIHEAIMEPLMPPAQESVRRSVRRNFLFIRLITLNQESGFWSPFQSLDCIDTEGDGRS